MENKICSKCIQNKSLSEFSPHKQQRDGLQPRCKECRKIDTREYRLINSEILKKKERIRSQSPLRRIQHKEWVKNNPERVKQHEQKRNTKHREKRLADRRNWYKQNREKVLEKGLQWREENREYLREKARKYAPIWRKQNPSKQKAKDQKRRAMERSAKGHFTGQEWELLCAHFSHKCLACNQFLPLEADHIIPLAKGGENNILNIQPLCRNCNAKKGVKIIDYRNEHNIETNSSTI